MINNAVEATPSGGKIRIHTLGSKNSLIIKVANSGSGFKIQGEDIFNPFFTTKKEGRGLGLTISRKIIAAHGGEIILAENSPEGVTFQVIIPMKIKIEKMVHL